jgi:SAM-dependent methyltransferase
LSATSEHDYAAFVADFYDHTPLYANRADVGFYLGAAREAAGPVLELGCGTGRILIPTARAGCAVTGLDTSEAMLERCRAKLAAEPAEVRARVRLLRASMTEFELEGRFRLVTAPFRSFQHLCTVEEQLACLACAHRQLEPGGRVILDFFHVDPSALSDPAWTAEREDSPETRLPDGRRFRRTVRIVARHRAAQVNDVEFVYYVTHPDGRAERLAQVFPLRYFFRYEVEHLLARAGFRVAALYGNFDRSPFADDSPEMIFLAEK